MSYIEDSSATGEELLYSAKFHWLYSIWAIFLIATLILSPFGLYLFVIKWTTETGVTSNRFVLKTGLIARKTEEINLSRIEEMNLQQSILGRIFGYGKLKVNGTGGNFILTPSIDDPVKLRREIANAKNC